MYRDEQKNNQNKIVTIADVARHVGVAKGTVSRVLNGYTDISESTRERVMQAVDTLGYRASATARNLKRGRVDTFGIVLPLTPGHGADPFLAEFLDGISRALSEAEKDLIVATASSAEDAVTVMKRLISSRKVDGFILTRTAVEDQRINYLLEAGFPFVCHGRDQRQDEHPWMDVDNKSAFRSAVMRLADMGHAHIALVSARPEMNFSVQRQQGFRDGMQAAGLAVRQELCVETSMDETGGEQAAEKLLKLNNPPTAIVCMTDAIAIGVCKVLRRFKIEVGRDISVIGYDGLPACAHFDPAITSFEQDPVGAGRQLAELLTLSIQGHAAKELQVLCEARLIPGGSDGPPRKTSEELARYLKTFT